jgi:anti-sigma regulatory factor (Ser/Thr protein kinase)
VADPLLSTRRHQLRFRPTLPAFEDAGRALRDVLDARRLGAAVRYNVELVFEEIAVNIIRHGSATDDVSTTVFFDDDEVVLEFEDDGIRFDPRQWSAPPSPASLEEAAVGGLGLVLVTKVCTRIEYERTSTGHNHVTLAIPAH